MAIHSGPRAQYQEGSTGCRKEDRHGPASALWSPETRPVAREPQRVAAMGGGPDLQGSKTSSKDGLARRNGAVPYS